MRYEECLTDCPHCGLPLIYTAMVSGHTYGAKVWSDGKVDAGMWQHFHDIGACSRCDGLVWAGEDDTQRLLCNAQELQGQECGFLRELSYEEYCQRAEDTPGLTPAQEQKLRHEAWWRWNDDLRTTTASEFPYLPLGSLILGTLIVGAGAMQHGIFSNFVIMVALMAAHCSFLVGLFSLRQKYEARQQARASIEAGDERWRGNIHRLLALYDEEDEASLLQKAELLRQLGEFEEAIRLLDRDWSPQQRPLARRLLEECRLGNREVCVVLQLDYDSSYAEFQALPAPRDAGLGALSIAEADPRGSVSLPLALGDEDEGPEGPEMVTQEG